MSDEPLSIYLITPETEENAAAIPGQGMELHSTPFLPRLFGDKELPQEQMRKSWADTQKMLVLMIADAEDEKKTGFRLSELEVNLSVSGKGNIGFVSAKAEASITLKFTRG